jgi:hypothetical protein
MFLHMKAGLESDVIHLPFSQESYVLEHTPLTPLGVRREFQQAVAELRTDLDAFTPDESAALMACGYKMASNALDDQLPDLASDPGGRCKCEDKLYKSSMSNSSAPVCGWSSSSITV